MKRVVSWQNRILAITVVATGVVLAAGVFVLWPAYTNPESRIYTTALGFLRVQRLLGVKLQAEAEHPIWHAHYQVLPGEYQLEGIDRGCKTVVVYSPQDLSCRWEANQFKDGKGLTAFRVGMNVIAYATGLEPPKPRLTPVQLIRDDPEQRRIPRGYLKVVQLRHEGDWQPAPRAMRNLMDEIQHGLDELGTVADADRNVAAGGGTE